MEQSRWMLTIWLVFAVLAWITLQAYAQRGKSKLQIEEMTIAGIHTAMKAGQIPCRKLVQQYLGRIQAYDRKGPAINSLVVLNPKALERAADKVSSPSRKYTTIEVKRRRGPLVRSSSRNHRSGCRSVAEIVAVRIMIHVT